MSLFVGRVDDRCTQAIQTAIGEGEVGHGVVLESTWFPVSCVHVPVPPLGVHLTLCVSMVTVLPFGEDEDSDPEEGLLRSRGAASNVWLDVVVAVCENGSGFIRVG
ncbi:hypothetical protein TGRH88_087824 [Toxoplasma gondii]|uniref:Uncharacterized protein n=1 Tax=Toxoplasma gondii TaxID=5811 RepID=A0A7J6KBK4_TOXGO|nr:hypothetical protein TGRH88_087824 [Toxoplasma gondii]